MFLLLAAPRGKRGWKTFYAILKGLILYLQKVSFFFFLHFQFKKEKNGSEEQFVTASTWYSLFNL